MLILSRADVDKAMTMSEALPSQEQAFRAWSDGGTEVPLRARVRYEKGEGVALFMPARVPGALGAKIVSVVPENRVRKAPPIHGVVILLDPSSGKPIAMIDGERLTVLRTAAGCAVAASVLAPKDASIGCLFGTGAQAEGQLAALGMVRKLELVRVVGRTREGTVRFIREASIPNGPTLVAAESAEQAVRDADIVMCATTSRLPLFDGSWLKAGAHLSAVGAFTRDAREIDSIAVGRAGKIFVDSRSAAGAEVGDVVIPLEEGVLSISQVIEIGEVLNGRHTGRTDRNEITIFKSVGFAAQDMFIAREILKCALRKGLGTAAEL